MTCIAHLVNEKNNKIVKVIYIHDDTYPLCEIRVNNLNSKRKNKEKRYFIVTVNV